MTPDGPGTSTVSLSPAALPRLTPLRFTRTELAGAVADLGVLLPIAVALIVGNGLSATAVVVPAGLLYVAVAFVYRLPVPVQPLKAFGAIAIAQGLGTSEIAAGALLMGVTFVVLGASGLLDRVARVFPRAVVRGIQLAVGLLFLRIAYQLVAQTPAAFQDHGRAGWALVLVAAVVAALALLLRRRAVTLVLVGVAVVACVLRAPEAVGLGPSAVAVPSLSWQVLGTALVVLVLPQLPLTFANSCLATADAAHTYFGPGPARRVTPSRLALTLGIANLGTAAVGGMPLCHGAGGLSAHHTFGARTGGAPLVLGATLVAVGIGLGAGLAALLSGFPVVVLAALLAVAGIAHLGLARDLRDPWSWAVALGVGVAGALGNLAIALVAGLVVWWSGRAVREWTHRRAARGSSDLTDGERGAMNDRRSVER